MSRGGIRTEIVESGQVGLGDNEFETGLINVPGNSVIKKGAVLKRVGGKFAPVTDTTTETPVAVNPFDIPNPNATAADLSLRAIISGPVVADMLLINDIVTTPEQNDMIRDHATIVPVKTHDISRVS